MSNGSGDGGRQSMRHTVRITVDPELGRVAADPDPLYIGPGDTVTWILATGGAGPFAIHFEPLSPLTYRRLQSEPGEEAVRGQVRRILQPGKYRYFVAVQYEGRIYTEDPELIDDNGEDPPPAQLERQG